MGELILLKWEREEAEVCQFNTCRGQQVKQLKSKKEQEQAAGTGG
jgi:hypothetical protein